MDQWIIFDAHGVIFRHPDDVNELLIPYVQERNKDITKEDITKI